MTVAERIVPALAAWAATGWFVAGHPTSAAAAPAPPTASGLAAPPATGHPASTVADRAGSETIGPPTAEIAAHPASRVPGHPASGSSAARPPGPGEPRQSTPYGQVVRDARQGPGLVCTYRLRGVRKDSFLNVREGAGIHHAPVAKLRPADGGFTGACATTRGWVSVKTPGGASGFASAHYLHRLDLSGRPSLACFYRLRHVRKGSFLNVREEAGIHHAPVGRLRRSDGSIAGACDATDGWVAVDTADGIPGWASARYLRRL